MTEAPLAEAILASSDPRSEIPPGRVGEEEADEGPYDVPLGVVNRRMFPPRRRRQQ